MNLKISRRNALIGTGLVAATIWLRPRLGHSATEPTPAGSPDGWSYIPSLSDDFTDIARSESLWHKGLWYPVSGLGEFKADNVEFQNNLLRLQATPQPGQDKLFGYGAVESNFDTPGVASFVEVRAKPLDSQANVLSAIWLQSSNRDGKNSLLKGANPNPEIDLIETFNFSQMNSATHIWPDNDGNKHVAFGGKDYNTGLDVSGDFHTFGNERRDGKLRAYFDGKLAWEMTAPDPSLALMSRHQVLSLEGHLGQPKLNFLPASFDIDYVRTFYYKAGARVSSGSYALVNASTGTAIIPAGQGFDVVDTPQGAHDSWTVKETDDFTYTIAAETETTMALQGGNGQPGVPVVLDDGPTGIFSDGSLRRWHITASGDDVFRIQSKFSGLALTLTSDGQLVQQSPDGSAAQNWRFVALQPSTPPSASASATSSTTSSVSPSSPDQSASSKSTGAPVSPMSPTVTPPGPRTTAVGQHQGLPLPNTGR